MADIEENNGFNDNIIKAKTKSHFSDIADVWNKNYGQNQMTFLMK